MRPRIVILSVLYSMEISPLLKALAMDATRRGADVTFVTDELYRDRGAVVVPDVAIRVLRPGWSSTVLSLDMLRRHRLGRLALRGFRKLDRCIMRSRLKRQLHGIELCIAAEYFSLSLAMEAGSKPQSTVYLSLEGADNCKTKRDRAIARRALPRCRVVGIASPERAEGLMAELLLPDMPFVYLPVSWHKSQAVPRLARKRDAGEVKLIYSGYFAPWAQLAELTRAFTAASRGTAWTLTIHGHSMSTEAYRDEVLKLAAGHTNIAIDEAYYEDARYVEFLSDFDVGVAMYSKSDGGSNWGNLSLSSGKIAGYSQAGLGIITNLDDALAHSEPFLPVSKIDGFCLAQAIQTYMAQPDVYRESSLRLFDTTYDAAPHTLRLWAALDIPGLSLEPAGLEDRQPRS